MWPEVKYGTTFCLQAPHWLEYSTIIHVANQASTSSLQTLIHHDVALGIGREVSSHWKFGVQGGSKREGEPVPSKLCHSPQTSKTIQCFMRNLLLPDDSQSRSKSRHRQRKLSKMASGTRVWGEMTFASIFLENHLLVVEMRRIIAVHLALNPNNLFWNCHW